MTRHLLTLALAGSLLGAACDDNSTAATGLPTRHVAARNLWHETRPLRYSFVASRACECTSDGAGPVSIEVNGAQLVSVKRVDNGANVDAALWFSIDDLFALIDTEAAQRPELLQADYDEHDGHPTHVAYGHREVDAGASIEITEFKALIGTNTGYLMK